MPALSFSTRDLGAVRDAAADDVPVALHVDRDTVHMAAAGDGDGGAAAVVVTGAPDAARMVADELARTLGARVRYVDEATACAAALGVGGPAVALSWNEGLSTVIAGDRGAVGDVVAGGFGHVSVDPLGSPCACGGRGCLQGQAGTRALTSQFATLSGRRLDAT
ncbi:MAG TPA: ROK family protein, partial [Baekduia sp.]|nr:ROK family protein [Baekduia sp.]